MVNMICDCSLSNYILTEAYPFSSGATRYGVRRNSRRAAPRIQDIDLTGSKGISLYSQRVRTKGLAFLPNQATDIHANRGGAKRRSRTAPVDTSQRGETRLMTALD